jgi:hypothetical protein
MPSDPSDKPTKTELRLWEKKKVDDYAKREAYLEENIRTLVYSLVRGQCTDVIRTRIETLDTYFDMSSESQALKLLKAIRDIVFNFQSQKYPKHALHEALCRFFLQEQDKNITYQSYLETFQNCVDVIECCGGTIGQNKGIIKKILKNTGKGLSTVAQSHGKNGTRSAR